MGEADPTVTEILTDALLALELGETAEVRRLVRKSITTIQNAAEGLRDDATALYELSELIRQERDDAQAQVGKLREALEEYASHQAWRCDYRDRYGACKCGLDDLMTELGLPLVPPNDPEAKKEE